MKFVIHILGVKYKLKTHLDLYNHKQSHQRWNLNGKNVIL